MSIWTLIWVIPLFFLFFFLKKVYKGTLLDKKEQLLHQDITVEDEQKKFATIELNDQTTEGVGAIVIDMQDYFMSDEKLKMVKNQIPIISFCRKNGIPVAVINYHKCGPITASLTDSTSGLPVFEKRKDDAFSQEDFQNWLKKNGVKTLIIMGVNACACVFETANSALKNGYRVITNHEIIGGYCGHSFCSGGTPEWYDKNTIQLNTREAEITGK
ncbi:MAG: isochorismatase family protein [Candidatus Parcubacteria bacterium]|nr:isochorismatase family protein [Candidatus Parcubacteria bacterium]